MHNKATKPKGFLGNNLYRFRSAINDMAAFVVVNKDWHIIEANDHFERLFGYSQEEIIGLPIAVLRHDTQNKSVYKEIREELAKEHQWNGELLKRTKLGVPLWVNMRIRFMAELDGYLVMYTSINRQRETHELSNVLYRHRAGFNRISANAVVSKEGDIIDVNDLFCELFGYTRQEIIGKSTNILKSGHTPREFYDRLWECVSKGEVWSGEILNKRKDHNLIWVRSTITLTKDDVSGEEAYLTIYQDIQDQKKAQDELNRMSNDMAAASERNNILSGALHNMGNQLTGAVSGHSRILKMSHDLRQASETAMSVIPGLPKEVQADYAVKSMQIINAGVAEIQRQADVSQRSLDDSVKILHSWKQQIKQCDVIKEGSIKSMMDFVLETFSLQLARHKISPCLSALPQNDVMKWPEVQVRQILQNLLKNAKEQICLHPSERDVINIAVEEAGDDVVITVQDTGGGFKCKPDELFAQGFTTKGDGGAGIGLHNAATMMGRMGGSITAENDYLEGKMGAKFTLRLPRFVQTA